MAELIEKFLTRLDTNFLYGKAERKVRYGFMSKNISYFII